MSGKDNIGRDSLILTVTQFITLGVNMINAMLLARFRTLSEYGTYSQVMTVCTIIITFMAAGFSQCINYFLGRSDTEAQKKAFIKNYHTIITMAGIVGGVAALLLLPVLEKYYGNAFLANFWFVFLFYPLSHIMTSGMDRFFIAYKKARGLFLFKVGHSIVVLAEIVLVLLLNWSFYQYMMLYTFMEVLFGISVFFWIRMITGVVPLGCDKNWIWQIMKFAIPMALASLVSSINTELDKLVVGGLVDTETFAIYTNAAKELPLYIVSTSISSVVMPFVVRKTAKEEYTGAAVLWRKSITLSYYLICFFVAALVVFAPQIISLLYSDKYLPGVDVFRVYSLVLLFRVTYYGMMLNALGRTHTILKASVATMVSNLVLDYILYRAMGLIGPAVATLISVGVMNIYQLLLTRKIVGLKFTDIYPVKSLLLITALNTAMGTVVYMVKQVVLAQQIGDPIVLSIVIGIVWCAVYLLIIRKKLVSTWNYLNKGDSKSD